MKTIEDMAMAVEMKNGDIKIFPDAKKAVFKLNSIQVGDSEIAMGDIESIHLQYTEIEHGKNPQKKN